MPVEEITLQHYLDQFTITHSPVPQRDQERPKIIVTSVICVSLAALAAAYRDPQLMQLAQRKYITALQLLARAIHDPKQSPAALTATSSFNLSMFESWATCLPLTWADPLDPERSQHGPEACWIARVWIYYQLCRILAHRIIQRSLTSPLQSMSWTQSDRLPAVVSQMASEVYDCIPAMLGSIYRRGKPSPCLSSNVFFLITILQALIQLTDKATVVDNWSSHVCKLYGEDFGVTKELVMMRLC
ncbi:hypothetical protein KXV92_009410 [Aspergillus fumigatus]|nr:hypothetical protein KXX42_003528 [Aspergillus fumigatus]KAH1551311.1 hypothetical protein KXX57_008733 [Aspergillus fumigatus]KAH1987134.1 hypothetical protein KXW88_004327 [Aspergillus fumigatus]KAH2312570.1 hypothetical protein KXV47_003761 [Aspergillus fumigatus]KAH2765584.1 hypothetical protein KXV94_004387 [Aspergillus fumigatus]